jgi:hypothetical protein
MTSLYPRRVKLRRSRTNAIDPTTGAKAVGLVGYSGFEQDVSLTNPAGEKIIASNIKCSIQARGIGKVKGLDVTEGDAPGPVQWRVFIPKTGLAKGVVLDRDLIVDDEGYRYQVAAAYWNLLGHRLDCIRLEV